MRKFNLLVIAITVLSVYSSFIFAQNRPLFKIERSKNANIVQYDANMDDEGRINEKNPIDYYWLLYASDGGREEITSFQKRAYGFSVKYDKAGYFDMSMQAVKDRPVRILLVNGEPKAEIMIDGKKSYLSKIYIDSKDNFVGIPTVNYYTLTGNDIDSGVETFEKIIVK